MTIFYSHICAVAKNNSIGLTGDLPWNIPEDLKFFKQKTLNKVIIMGRKTFESLGKPLPKRLNIVISRNTHFSVPSNVLLCSSLEAAYKICETTDLTNYDPEIFIIGGGQIYKQSMSKVKFIYLTRIHQQYTGDAFYPEIPTNQFKEIKTQHREGDPSYSFILYQKI